MKNFLSVFVAFSFFISIGCSSSSKVSRSEDIPNFKENRLPSSYTNQLVSVDEIVQAISNGYGFEISVYVDGIEVTVGNGSRKARTDIATFANKMSEVQGVSYRSVGFPYDIAWNRISSQDFSIVDIRQILTAAQNEVRKGHASLELVSGVSNTPLSITGPVISVLSTGSGYVDGARPVWSSNGITAYDVRKKKPADLLELVTEKSFVEALKEDRFLMKHLPAQFQTKVKNATRFAEIHNLFNTGFNECDFYWPLSESDILASFAIYDYDKVNNRVLVRLAVNTGCDSNQGNLVQLGLSLTPVPSFRKILEQEMEQATATRTKPLFMKYQLFQTYLRH